MKRTFSGLVYTTAFVLGLGVSTAATLAVCAYATSSTGPRWVTIEARPKPAGEAPSPYDDIVYGPTRYAASPSAWERVLELFRPSLKAARLFEVARDYSLHQQHKEALAAAKGALSAAPKDPRYRVAYAICLANVGQLRRAEAELLDVTLKNPEFDGAERALAAVQQNIADGQADLVADRIANR